MKIKKETKENKLKTYRVYFREKELFSYDIKASSEDEAILVGNSLSLRQTEFDDCHNDQPWGEREFEFVKAEIINNDSGAVIDKPH